jgi:hypothetical protein
MLFGGFVLDLRIFNTPGVSLAGVKTVEALKGAILKYIEVNNENLHIPRMKLLTPRFNTKARTLGTSVSTVVNELAEEGRLVQYGYKGAFFLFSESFVRSIETDVLDGIIEEKIPEASREGVLRMRVEGALENFCRGAMAKQRMK